MRKGHSLRTVRGSRCVPPPPPQKKKQQQQQHSLSRQRPMDAPIFLCRLGVCIKMFFFKVGCCNIVVICLIFTLGILFLQKVSLIIIAQSSLPRPSWTLFLKLRWRAAASSRMKYSQRNHDVSSLYVPHRLLTSVSEIFYLVL